MVKQASRPAIFTWRHTEPELILCAVRWSLRDSLSFRDGEERRRERGLEADPTTIWRWVQHDGPELEERLRRHPSAAWRETCQYTRSPADLSPVGLEFVIRPPLEAGPCPGSGRSNAHG